MRSHRSGNEKRKGCKRFFYAVLNFHYARPIVRQAVWPSLLWKPQAFIIILCNISAGGISMKPPGAFYGFHMAYI